MASSAPFLSQLAASGVPFVACDRPDVNHRTIQDLAIAAQKRKTAKIEKINEMRAAGTLSTTGTDARIEEAWPLRRDARKREISRPRSNRFWKLRGTKAGTYREISRGA